MPAGCWSKKWSNPIRPNDCLQTSYSYDAYGNKTGITTSACAGATG